MPRLKIPINELNAFDLPRVCVITGAKEGVCFMPVKLTWKPPWVSALVLVTVLTLVGLAFAVLLHPLWESALVLAAALTPVGLLFAALLLHFMTRNAQGELPFSKRAHRRWRLGAGLLSSAMGVAGLLALLASTLFGSGEPALACVAIAVAVGLPAGVHLALVRGCSLRVVRIDAAQITLDTPSSESARLFADRLFGGAA